MRTTTTRIVLALGVSAVLLLGGCDAFMSTEARIAKADRLLSQQDYRGAIIELKNVLQAEPANAAARLKLAEASLKVGDVESARKDLERAVEGGVTSPEVSRLAADIRLAAGQFRDLLVQIDSGELSLPDSLRSEYRGRALLALREYQDAVTAFNAALKADPGNTSALMGLAQTHAGMGQSDTALAELDALLKSKPDLARAQLIRGTIYAQRGEFGEARQAFTQARAHAAGQLDPRQQGVLLAGLTETQLALGDLDGARGTHGELRALAPKWALTELLQARIDMAEGKYRDAAAVLQPLVSTSPDLAPARFLLGAALAAQGSLHQAERHLTRVLEQAPGNLEARKLLARVRLQLKRPDEAVQLLAPVAQADDSDPQLDALVGLAQLQSGDTRKAIRQLEDAAARHPGERTVQLELASGYLHAGQPRKALELLRAMPRKTGDARREILLVSALAGSENIAAARKLVEGWVSDESRNVPLLNIAAEFFARQGEFERARTILAQASAAAPDSVATWLNWARVEVASGDVAAAGTRLEKVLTIDSHNAPAQLGLAQLAIRGGDLPQARKRLEAMRAADRAAIAPRLQLIRLHLQQNEAKLADEVIRETLRAAPERADLHNAIGSLYLEASRYEEALARFREAAALDGSNELYWMNIARAQLALGHEGVARESLQRALAERPDWVPAVEGIALLDLKANKPDEALARVAELRKKRPEDRAAMVLEGDVCMLLERYACADAAYGRATAVHPDGTVAFKRYSARQKGRLDRATEPLEEWVERSPDDFAARTLLAEAYQRGGQVQRAIRQYELIVQNRSNAAALNNLAWLYHETADARAEQTARQAYEQAAALPQVADTYGWILVESGRVAEGLAVLRKAAAGEGTDPEIQYHLAVALARSGAPSEARSRLSRLLEGAAQFKSRDAAEKLLAQLAAGE